MTKPYEKYLDNELDPAFRRRAEVILENLDIIPGKSYRILDLGCGRGFYTKAISETWKNCSVVGVDKNIKYLEQLKKTVSQKNVAVLQGDARELPFKNNSFDRIVCSELLEHIPEDREVVREMLRTIKPGGVIMISVPCKDYPRNWDPINWLMEKYLNRHVPSRIWWLAGIWADHVRLYSEQDLRRLLKIDGASGLKIWKVVQHCMPLAHFCLYGIGKNLVELGVARNFDRFNYAHKKSAILEMAKTVINMWDNRNDEIGYNFRGECVNLVAKLVKER